MEALQSYLISIAHDINEGKSLSEVAQNLPEVYVYPALHDKAYGGSEEGGWWFDTYQVIKRSKRPNEGFKMMPLCEAIKYVQAINARLQDTVNANRRPISSVLSNGEYTYLYSFDYPINLPTERPYYS